MNRRPREPLISVGNQIRKVREEKGYSQMGFAAQAGLARAYYGGIERGERNAAIETLIKIAAALEVEVGMLFPTLDELNSKL